MNKPKLNVTANISLNKTAKSRLFLSPMDYIRYSQTSVKEKMNSQVYKLLNKLANLNWIQHNDLKLYNLSSCHCLTIQL